jgi:hypothetical protein
MKDRGLAVIGLLSIRAVVYNVTIWMYVCIVAIILQLLVLVHYVSCSGFEAMNDNLIWSLSIYGKLPQIVPRQQSRASSLAVGPICI